LTPPQQPKQTSPLPTLHPQETKRQPTIASSTIPLDDGDLGNNFLDVQKRFDDRHKSTIFVLMGYRLDTTDT
jgi:hypothetical protein